ncbi:hypothetical protein BGX33_009310 [Mortierella sp. NVP41]|nr:hypothetical protein BGX33_009310 [Mortierella sp. NVP41]
MVRFTDLPSEILDLIGDDLALIRCYCARRASFRALILTCQLFRQHFTRHLWDTIEICDDPQRPQLDAPSIKNHANWIRTLVYTGYLPMEYYDISFPILVSLRYRVWGDGGQSEVTDSKWSRLIRLNPTIRDIEISIDFDPAGYKETWETIATSLRNPRCFMVCNADDHQTPGPDGDAFWKACARFEEIDYYGLDRTDSDRFKDLDFSRLERLQYQSVDCPSRPENLRGWIGGCSNLTQLHFGCDYGSTSLQAFISLAERTAWPLLEDLSLRRVQGSDEQYAAFLGHLPPLKYLSLPPPESGGAIYYTPLRQRHFDSLRSLDVSAFWGFDSSKALDALQNSPQLEKYFARRISLKDLRASPQPWACLRLKSLTVFFASDPDESGDNTLLFDQLSKLSRLEVLDVSLIYDQDTNSQKIVEKAPQWRLDSGLSQLSTLTRLQRFNFARTNQELREEDIEWMLKHWLRLEELPRTLSTDQDTQSRLCELVKQRGIRTFRR